MDAQGHKVIVCDNGTGVRSTESVSMKFIVQHFSLSFEVHQMWLLHFEFSRLRLSLYGWPTLDSFESQSEQHRSSRHYGRR